LGVAIWVVLWRVHIAFGVNRVWQPVSKKSWVKMGRWIRAGYRRTASP
jgi:hypothetical protein